MKMGIKISLIIYSLIFGKLVFAELSQEVKMPSHNCPIGMIEKLSVNLACGGYFNDTNYKQTYSGITLKGYSCPKDFTWKFTEKIVSGKTQYLVECENCKEFTLNECPDAVNGICKSCINGKIKWEGCKPGYKWNESKKKCIIPAPEILGCEKAIPSCTKAGEVGIAADRFTNKTGIAQNSGVQCDANDIIMCTGDGIGCQLAACNVGAKYSVSDSCRTGMIWYSSANSSFGNGKCTTDRLGLHFQWGSSVGYKFENTYSLSHDNYPVDSGLQANSRKITDRWTQGPCPSGYHIPKSSEWKAVVEAGNVGKYWTLGTYVNGDGSGQHKGYRARVSGNQNNFTTKLKLPNAGFRYLNSGIRFQGYAGLYWSSQAHDTISGRARSVYAVPTQIRPIYINGITDGRWDAFSVRCFKD